MREAGREEEDACALHRGVLRGDTLTFSVTFCSAALEEVPVPERLTLHRRAHNPSHPPAHLERELGKRRGSLFTIHQCMISTETSASQLRFG